MAADAPALRRSRRCASARCRGRRRRGCRRPSSCGAGPARATSRRRPGDGRCRATPCRKATMSPECPTGADRGPARQNVDHSRHVGGEQQQVREVSRPYDSGALRAGAAPLPGTMCGSDGRVFSEATPWVRRRSATACRRGRAARVPRRPTSGMRLATESTLAMPLREGRGRPRRRSRSSGTGDASPLRSRRRAPAVRCAEGVEIERSPVRRTSRPKAA